MSILEILEAHYDAAWNYKGRRECACGHEFTAGYSAQHRAHVAQVVEQHEREAKAEALEEAAANLARESDQFATTAERLTGHDNTRYHAYSAARQSIAHQLRNRAAQLKENI